MKIPEKKIRKDSEKNISEIIFMYYFIQNNFSELRTNRELKCLGKL